MNFKKFMRLAVKEADERYMREEGEQNFRENILPLLDSAQHPRWRIKYSACLLSCILLLALSVALCASCIGMTLGFNESFYNQTSSNLETVNLLLKNACIQCETDVPVTEFSKYGKNCFFRISKANLQQLEKGQLDIVVSDYKYFKKSDLQQTGYIGWELRYRIVQENYKGSIKFSAYGELYTGEEEIYLNYEQISTDGQCNFFGFLEQTVAKKGESASILAQ